jgi:hypothetical protein
MRLTCHDYRGFVIVVSPVAANIHDGSSATGGTGNLLATLDSLTEATGWIDRRIAAEEIAANPPAEVKIITMTAYRVRLTCEVSDTLEVWIEVDAADRAAAEAAAIEQGAKPETDWQVAYEGERSPAEVDSVIDAATGGEAV